MNEVRAWLDDIIEAMHRLNGGGRLCDIYTEIEKIRDISGKRNWKSAVRMNIEQHSSDSEAFIGKEDLFYSINGIGSGSWGLRDYAVCQFFSTQEDGDEGHSRRIDVYVQRIVRSTKIVRKLKQFHANRCQLCNVRLEIADNVYYSEGHHIKPLGKPYDGPDNEENILILCPNCHVLCDNRSIKLPYHFHFDGNKSREISKEFIDFHNNLYFQKLADKEKISN